MQTYKIDKDCIQMFHYLVLLLRTCAFWVKCIAKLKGRNYNINLTFSLQWREKH